MGAFLAQDELGIPAIGGKDSMSGTFNDINVPPSLISFALAVADTTKLISRAFKAAGNNVYLLKTPVDSGGIAHFGKLKDNLGSVYNLVRYGCIKSASVVGMGGIAAAVSEMAFGNGIGFKFDHRIAGNQQTSDSDEIDLFTPLYASMILELDTVPEESKDLRNEFVLLGVTTDTGSIEIGETIISLDEALKAWEGTLSNVFPIHEEEKNQKTARQSSTPQVSISGSASCASVTDKKNPQVVIPVFPGTTGEYELLRQFRKAGADVEAVVFRTLTASDIDNAYMELTDAINRADIMAIPSGMSAGGEPDGSGKLIALVLRHREIKDAVNKLLGERKGLILGLGEGFKALLKTGLIQTGQIQEKENEDVVLARNLTNRHICTLKQVKINQVKSPWFTGISGDVEIVPVSGQDIDVHMSDELHNKYLEERQIVANYLDTGEKSPYGIEAMISANGLVLGRTGLVENLKTGLYANVFDAKESRIFTNAVEYIKGINRRSL